MFCESKTTFFAKAKPPLSLAAVFVARRGLTAQAGRKKLKRLRVVLAQGLKATDED